MRRTRSTSYARAFFPVLLAILIHPLPVHAAGTVQHLDPTFGAAGVVTTSDPPPGAVKIQPDGMIVTGGSGGVGFEIARFTATGAPDTTFGTAGATQIDLAGSVDVLFAIAIQSDGKIVAVGETEIDDEEALGVVRLESDGSLDATFGTGGVVVEDVSVEGYAVAIQDDGAIVIAGEGEVGGARVAALARLTSAGALDPTFGAGGVTHPDPFADLEGEQFWAVALQGDGKIVVSGTNGGNVLQQDFLVMRFESDGSTDVSFGDDGAVRTFISESQDVAWGVAIQPDGKIVAGGDYYPTPPRTGFALARYLTDGTLDPTFGEAGIVRTPFAVNSSEVVLQDVGGFHGAYARAMVLTPDGRIVVAGDSVVARYHADGGLDDTFGGGAIQTLFSDANAFEYGGVAAQPDGKVIAVGTIRHQPGGVVTRYAACDCPACEFCDGSGGCVAAPRTDCFGAYSTSISLKDSSDNASDSVSWKWSKGDEVPPNAVGMPYGATDYAFCAYDESSGPSLVARATLPAGAACSGAHCWRTSAKEDAAKFTNKDGAAGPITTATVKAGELYKTSARVKGKGAGLGMAALPPAGPLRVQLQSENGQCWEAVYDAADIVRAQPGSLKAVTDSADH